jgi:hypothetical protein
LSLAKNNEQLKEKILLLENKIFLNEIPELSIPGTTSVFTIDNFIFVVASFALVISCYALISSICTTTQLSDSLSRTLDFTEEAIQHTNNLHTLHISSLDRVNSTLDNNFYQVKSSIGVIDTVLKESSIIIEKGGKSDPSQIADIVNLSSFSTNLDCTHQNQESLSFIMENINDDCSSVELACQIVPYLNNTL